MLVDTNSVSGTTLAMKVLTYDFKDFIVEERYVKRMFTSLSNK